MRLISYYLCFILLVINVSCSYSEGSLTDGIITVDMTEINTEKDGSLFFDSIYNPKVIPIGFNDNTIISQIENLKMVDDRIYFIDKNTKSVHCCNKSGDLQLTIKRLGRGPGEYSHLTDYCIHNNNIYILDRITQNIIVCCSSTGEYKNTIHLQESRNFSKIIVNQGSIFLSSQLSTRSQYAIYEFDFKGNLKNKALKFDPHYIQRLDEYELNSTLREIDGVVHYSLLMNNNIYEFNPDGIHVKYKFDFGNRDIETYINNSNSRNNFEYFEDGLNANDIVSLTGHMAESSDYLVSYFTKGSRMFILLYDKVNNTAKVYPNMMNGLYFLMGANSPIHYLGDSTFATVLDPFNFCPLPEVEELNGHSKNLCEVYHQIKEISPNVGDNAMIMLFNL